MADQEQVVHFEGTEHHFPADFTADDITKALNSAHPVTVTPEDPNSFEGQARARYRTAYHQEPPPGYPKHLPGTGLDEITGASLGTGLAVNPIATLVGTGTGAGAQAGAEAMGFGPVGSTIAGLAGGALGGGVTTGIQRFGVPSLREIIPFLLHPKTALIKAVSSGVRSGLSRDTEGMTSPFGHAWADVSGSVQDPNYVPPVEPPFQPTEQQAAAIQAANEARWQRLHGGELSGREPLEVGESPLPTAWRSRTLPSGRRIPTIQEQQARAATPQTPPPPYMGEFSVGPPPIPEVKPPLQRTPQWQTTPLLPVDTSAVQPQLVQSGPSTPPTYTTKPVRGVRPLPGAKPPAVPSAPSGGSGIPNIEGTDPTFHVEGSASDITLRASGQKYGVNIPNWLVENGYTPEKFEALRGNQTALNKIATAAHPKSARQTNPFNIVQFDNTLTMFKRMLAGM